MNAFLEFLRGAGLAYALLEVIWQVGRSFVLDEAEDAADGARGWWGEE